jgi:hypothetical protein
MATTSITKQEAYKKACDEALLARGKERKNRTTVELQNGSSLSFLKKLQAPTKND